MAGRICLPVQRQCRPAAPLQSRPSDAPILRPTKHGVCWHYLRQEALAAALEVDLTRYLTNQKQGVSALELLRVLSLGRYATAWTMLHRFRRAMVRPRRGPLKGKVEVDESYLALTERQQPVSAQLLLGSDVAAHVSMAGTACS